MASDQTIKWTFEVPASATHVGTLDVSPHFHRSRIFAAGGYDWSISYYPESLYHHDGIDLCLHLESQGSAVTISSSVAVVDDSTVGLPPLKLVEESPPMELDYDYDDESRRTLTHWVPKSNLIATPSQYQGVDSYLMFEWTITIFKEMLRPTPMLMPMPEPETLLMPIPEPVPKVPAPDVTFSVSGDLFHAHKAILSMHSPVFKAELSSVAAAAVIEVDGMRPDVFEALLHYIYTNTLPATEDEDDVIQTMRDLLVAADRYGVEGLKILCEGELSKMVDVDNVADMLALADDLGSYVLEDACIEFMVSSGRMKNVVKSQGYQRLRMKHPLVLVDVLEKYLIFRNLYMSC